MFVRFFSAKNVFRHVFFLGLPHWFVRDSGYAALAASGSSTFHQHSRLVVATYLQVFSENTGWVSGEKDGIEDMIGWYMVKSNLWEFQYALIIDPPDFFWKKHWSAMSAQALGQKIRYTFKYLWPWAQCGCNEEKLEDLGILNLKKHRSNGLTLKKMCFLTFGCTFFRSSALLKKITQFHWNRNCSSFQFLFKLKSACVSAAVDLKGVDFVHVR